MTTLRLRVTGDALADALRALRAELGVPAEFPPEVLAEATEAARSPRLPGLDARDVDLLTLDPPGSRDLDQALGLSRRPGGGYAFRYAIADVAAFVRPGGAVDAEAHRRVQTLYSPDTRTPLHPPVLSEDAASLLPGVDRPAVLWSLDLDADAEPERVEVRRALVRSRRRLDYATVQGQLEAGTADEALLLLREVGRLRQERERERGAVDLPLPEEEVVPPDAPGGAWGLALRAPLPSEGWNAQLSLLTGSVAARLMLDGGAGLLRTLPAPPPAAYEALRGSAAALGVDWPDGAAATDVLRRLDAARPEQAALLQVATRLLRGAGHLAFVDGPPPTGTAWHAGVASAYAHVTAPLRRLADRYAAEACLAHCAGEPVPEWVLAALPTLPGEMAAGGQRAGALERAVVDLVEAVLLEGCTGREFAAAVVEARADGSGPVQLVDPPVRGTVRGAGLVPGTAVRVRLVAASPATRTVEFAPV